MKTQKIILSLALALILTISLASAAISVSQSYSQDLVRVKERWSYQEDTSGRNRGFNLIHVYSVPRENIEINYRDSNPSSSNVNTNAQIQTQRPSVLDSGFGSGIVGSAASRIASNSGGSMSGNSFGGASGVGNSGFSYSNIGYSSGSSAGLNDAFRTYQQNSQPRYSYNYNTGYFSGWYGGYSPYYGYAPYSGYWSSSPGYAGYWW